MAIDATPAGTAADSYLTVAEADTYAGNRLGPEVDAWQAATLEEKEKALKQATTSIETWQRRAGGYAVVYSSTQLRLYPRDIDIVGTPAVAYLLPQVKEATFAQAAWLLRNVKNLADAASRLASGIFSQSDDDGSWTAAVDPTRGLFSPEMIVLLGAIPAAGRTGGAPLVSVPMASSFPP